MKLNKPDPIRDFIFSQIKKHPKDITNIVSEKFGITRQAAHRRLKALVDEKLLERIGVGRSSLYTLATILNKVFKYPVKGLQEDVVWRNDIEPLLTDLPENVKMIWHYGVTEMVNNAVDHSEGSQVTVFVNRNYIATQIGVQDDGIGIFNKIKRDFQLDDVYYSLLELSKGKLTTDPNRHSGEGIFFTSKVFDDFAILSRGLVYEYQAKLSTDSERAILLRDHEEKIKGTLILMEVANTSERTTKEVFDEYTGSDFIFSKTIVPVRLAKYGNENLVSRSQAKRLLARVEIFKNILLDFREVPLIGQGFADEVFRVFVQDHPEIKIGVLHANSEVEKMIKHVTRA
jgi:DNA-binding Lrp family transcriptional regulator